MATRMAGHVRTTSIWDSPVVFLPALLIVADILIFAITDAAGNVVIPVELIAGFTYRVLPLTPAFEAIVLAIALCRYSGVSAGQSVIAAVLMFVLRLVAAFIFGYTMSVVTPMLSDAVVSKPTSFYGPLLGQSVLTGAAVLVVLAYYERAFRSWIAWLYILLIWGFGTTFLFVLYHDQVIGMGVYPELSNIVRILGFAAVGYGFAMAARGEAD